MRLRHIEVFHAVYSSGSITAAAAVLHVSQPSVSKVLAHAERQLGYALFERVKGKVVPTPEAHRLFGYVSVVYKNIGTLRNISKNLRSADAGTIKVATTPSFGVDLLPSAISSYRQEHDSVKFEIETLHYAEVIDALLESRMDIGVVFDAEPVPGIASEFLATGDFMVLAPENMKFAGKKTLRLSDLANKPFVSLNKKGPLGRVLDAHIESSGVEFDTVAWSETYQVAKALVARAIGITIADAVTARSLPHDGIRVWPLKPRLKFNVNLLHLGNVPSSLLTQDFVQHLRNCIADLLARRN